MNTAKILMLVGILGWALGCSRVNPVGVDEIGVEQADEKSLEVDEEFVIADNDFIQDQGLAKSSDLFGTNYKWHYRRFILPKQSGKLYWCIETSCKDAINARAVAAQSFAIWQPYVPFTFTETTNPKVANVVIRFINQPTAPLKSGTIPWWSGGSVYLGFGYAPHENYQGLCFDYWGDILINDLYVDWAKNPVTLTKPGSSYIYRGTFNLQKVLTHEIGHALGLSHDQTSSKNIMNPKGPSTANGFLYDSDIKFATMLYDYAYQMVYGQEYANKTVTDAFKKILARAPTSTELQTYSTKLVFNRMPSKRNYDYRRLLTDLAGSSMNWIRAGSNSTTFVKNVHLALLGRAATTAEIKTYTTNMKNGWPATRVASALVGSTEWQQKYIKSVYSLQLGQTVNATALSTLTSNLAANKIEPFEITYDCLKNPAYFKKCSPQSNGGLINRAYLTLLATKPSTAAYNTWLSLID